MADLAKQAFNTNNFDLSAEIYERNIKEKGPKLELYLGLADSYAKGGHLKKAFEAYTQAYRLGTVKPWDLNQLVSALVDIMRDKHQENSKNNEQSTEDVFACGSCLNLWLEPVTISCGHTFCRGCLEKEPSRNCKKCQVPRKNARVSSMKTNVLLSRTIQKWFTNEVKAIQLKKEGNDLFQEKKYIEAIEVYSRAFECAPTDHTIPSNRSFAYASIKKYTEALDDAELVISLRPDWPKGYYRKATALSALGRQEEASFAYLQCLALDPQVTSARKELAKSLHKMLSTLPPEDLKRAELQSYLNPFPMARAMGMLDANRGHDHPSSPLPFFLTKDTLPNLRTKLLDAAAQISKDEQTEQHASTNNTDAAPNRSTAQKVFLSPSQSHDGGRRCKPAELDRGGCHSAPSTPPASPLLLGKRSRSRSDSKLQVTSSTEDNIRVCTDMEWSPTESVQPSSPSKSPSAKQARKSEKATEQPKGQRPVALELRDKEDFECNLCYRLLYLPVSTPCGHVFCRQCLDRCLDHSTVCPLCKSTLVEYLAERRQAVTEALFEIIRTYFPAEYMDRHTQYEQEIAELARMGADDRQEIPVFVCTLAYPKMACPLHIFEPRYRLMIRQSMESGTRQFGMCIHMDDVEGSFADYGCTLEIRDVQYFPDGRSVVDTVGGRRFRVLSRGMRDGYHTAKVEFLKDRPEQDESELQAVQDLHDQVHKLAEEWLETIPAMAKMRIQQHMGDIPAVEQNPIMVKDGPAWHWWLLAVLPLDPRAQLSIIAMTSLSDRLIAMRRVLTYVQRKSRTQ